MIAAQRYLTSAGICSHYAMPTNRRRRQMSMGAQDHVSVFKNRVKNRHVR